MDAFYQLRYFLLLFGLLTLTGLSAQVNRTDTQEEDTPPQPFFQPNPPPQNVRTMGEWEEVEGLVIAWEDDYEDILTQIVRYAVEECLVYIIAPDFSNLQIHLIQSQIPLGNLRFITSGFNSVWIRDYGPWTVYLQKVHERGISDYLYNRPNRLLDDQIPYEVADYIGSPLYNADENPYRWMHSGGNFLMDGVHTGYSSDLVLRENSGKTGLEIAEYARLFFGIEDYRILSRLNYDTIHHLDMHMRTLDEETIAIGEYPPGVADGPVIEANLQFLRNHYRTPYGKPYRILRLPMPPQGGQYPPFADYLTYTNSVFLNKTIMVPTYDAPSDSIALQLYRDYFPGYRVVGINCNEIIDELGALHCITKLVGVKRPLWIAHPRLRDVYGEQSAHPVDAWIYHETGITSATLYYRTNEEATFLPLPMTRNTNDPDHWQAALPAIPLGTEVHYYIEALANSGKRQVRPLPAPAGYYHFQVKDWTSPPVAQWVQTEREVAPGTQIMFTNDSEEGPVSWTWTFPGGVPLLSNNEEVTVTYPNPGQYSVRLVAANPLGADTLLRPNSIRVREAFPPFSESFPTSSPTAWEIINPDNGNVQWQWRAEGGCNGPCLEVPHRDSPQKLNREYLRTAIDLRGYTQASLQFAVAYAQRHPLHFDELRVNLVDQQGHHHNIYNKGGNVLATVGMPIPGFVPSNCNDWRTETVDLSPWEGQQFILEIESIGDRGNSIYLDEISLAANALPQANIAFPANNTLYIGVGPLQQIMRVEASDSDGEIAEIDFFQGSNFLGSDVTPPYEMPFLMLNWGHYNLQARATDNEGAQVWTQSITVRYDYENGTSSLGNLPVSVTLVPNPVNTKAALLIQSEAAYRGLELTISNPAGQIIQQWVSDLGSGTSRLEVPVEQLPAGAYWLQVRYEDQQLVLPLVKQ
jgi:agmatine/peptidylarginine deiminase/PKD repeat protein